MTARRSILLTLLLLIASAVASAAISVTPTTLPAATVGTPYTVTLTAAGGTAPYTFTVAGGSTLPAGLTLTSASATTATIAGTPTAAGSPSFTIDVEDSFSTLGGAPYSMTISAAPLSITPGPALLGGASVLAAGSVGVAYSATIAATGGTPPYSWSIATGSALPAGLTINASTGAITGKPTMAATSSFAVQVHDAASGTASQIFSLTITASANSPTINTSTVPTTGIVNVAYTGSLSATGGTAPYTFSLASGSVLPAGLTLTGAGAITGKPTAAGTTLTVFQVTDSANPPATATASVSIVIASAGLSISTTSLLEGVVGSTYSATLSASGGTSPYTWSITTGTLTAGLTLNGSTGVISGTPTATGTSSFTIQVKDATGATATQALGITIVTTALSFPSASLPAGTVGTPYSATLSATGGTPPFAFSIATGTLPAGLTLTNAGVISGTPTTGVTSSFVVQVKDSGSGTASQTLSITIASTAAPTLTVGLTGSTVSAQQPTLAITLSSAYTVALNGTLTLTFTPAGSVTDPNVQFVQNPANANSAAPLRSIPFAVGAGMTTATFPVTPSGGSATTATTKVMTGTTAGTISVAISALTDANGNKITPPAPTVVTLNATPPVISNVTVTSTTSSLSVAVTGYSTSRDMSSMTFHFAPTTGTNLTSTSVTVDVSSAFETWYASAASVTYGTQFTVTVPFTFSGTAFPVAAVTVDMTNSKGTSTESNPASP